MAVAGAAALVIASGGCGPGRGVSSRAPKAAAPADPAVQAKAAQPSQDKKPPAAYKPEEPSQPTLIITPKDVTLRWIENGKVRMSATAKTGQINELTKIAVLNDFSADLYEKGKLTTSMSAPKVVADTDKRIVTATGGVKMKSLDRKTTVNSEWVKWYSKQQKIIGDGGVVIKSDTWDVNSAAFVADTGLKTIKVMNSSKGLIP